VPVIGPRAEKINTRVPVAQFVTGSETETPKTSEQPRGLQVDANQLDAAALKLNRKKEGDVRPKIDIPRVAVASDNTSRDSH